MDTKKGKPINPEQQGVEGTQNSSTIDKRSNSLFMVSSNSVNIDGMYCVLLHFMTFYLSKILLNIIFYNSIFRLFYANSVIKRYKW